MADPTPLARYRQAKKDLHRLQAEQEAAGVDYETDEYLALNRTVNELAADVPWWRR